MRTEMIALRYIALFLLPSAAIGKDDDRAEQAVSPCFLGDLARQGEAIAFRDDGRLLLTSETTIRMRRRLQMVRCAGVGRFQAR